MVSTKVNAECPMFFLIFFKCPVIGVQLANRVDVLCSCPSPQNSPVGANLSVTGSLTLTQSLQISLATITIAITTAQTVHLMNHTT